MRLSILPEDGHSNNFRWTAEHDFNDEGQVTTFHDIMPLSFDKTRIGNIWHAPQDWIGQCNICPTVKKLKRASDKERHMYYTENPQAYTKINSPKFVLEKRRIDRTERLEAKLEGREPFTLSVCLAVHLCVVLTSFAGESKADHYG